MSRPGLMLGKLPRKRNSKTLLFSNYLRASALPPPPTKKAWEYKVAPSGWGMYGNDTIGDCTCAAVAHMLIEAESNTGKINMPALSSIIGAYSAVSGYDPVTGANDNGAAITDVLNLWQTSGIASTKILGWVQIDQTNIEQVKQAIYIFGALDIGVNLPNSAMDQFEANQTWTVLANDGGIDGGHSIPLFGYGTEGASCITWAKIQPMDWQWFQQYCDEAYAAIVPAWLNTAGKSPSDLDLEALKADLEAIRS